MSLEKLTIMYEKDRRGSFTGSLSALFNPNQLSYSKTVTWEPEKTVRTTESPQGRSASFRSVELETLSVSLLFDVYEDVSAPEPSGAVAVLGARLLGRSGSAHGVREHTRGIAALAHFSKELEEAPGVRAPVGARDADGRRHHQPEPEVLALPRGRDPRPGHGRLHLPGDPIRQRQRPEPRRRRGAPRGASWCAPATR